MHYPATKRIDVIDVHFAERIADPYCWLENTARTDPEVAAWASAQDRVAHSYLAELPGRDAFRAWLTDLFDCQRFTASEKLGNRYSFTRNGGLDK